MLFLFNRRSILFFNLVILFFDILSTLRNYWFILILNRLLLLSLICLLQRMFSNKSIISTNAIIFVNLFWLILFEQFLRVLINVISNCFRCLFLNVRPRAKLILKFINQPHLNFKCFFYYLIYFYFHFLIKMHNRINTSPSKVDLRRTPLIVINIDIGGGKTDKIGIFRDTDPLLEA